MNKTMTFVLASILLLSMGFVAASTDTPARDGTGEYHDDIVAAGGLNGTGEMVQTMNQLQEGTYNLGDGQQIQVQAGENNRLRLMTGEHEAQTGLELSSDGQKLQAKLSNGRIAEVKVMPDRASEKALERLRIKNCSGECNIELKQVGEGEQAKLAYEVKTQRESKVFGLFRAQMQVNAQVDAESGEVLRVGKPWWAFLATEPEEQ